MAIPDYQTVMLPLLRRIGDGKLRLFKDVVAELADEFALTADERAHLLPSGGTLTFASRAGWAKTYMKKAGLLVQPRRGHVEITGAGKEVLASNPPRIDVEYLARFPSFLEFRLSGKDKADSIDSAQDKSAGELTPDEVIESAYRRSREALADELLDRVKNCTPAYFERLVVQLLIKMGYGGSREEAGQAVGQTGDGGIDGVINEDRLGLDAIYVQAKKWDGRSVGSEDIRGFIGALDNKEGAHKGVFITTSTFSPTAVETARKSRSYKLVLIDGKRLADLMIEHDLGVSAEATYQLKRIDSDFFVEE